MRLLANYISYAPEAAIIPLAGLVVAMWMRSVRGVIGALTLFVLMLAFYRGDCHRPTTAPAAPASAIISPCEGRIMTIDRRHDYIRVATFLGIHNVHVQYAPVSGEIVSVTHKAGEFVPAYFFEKSKYNERVETVIRPAKGSGDVTVVQIAGQIARRIVPFKRPGERVTAGEPLGLIKFGSRVDIIIPRWLIHNLHVSEGELVKIGDLIAS
jgi:phosphatidylserine decarboxylase